MSKRFSRSPPATRRKPAKRSSWRAASRAASEGLLTSARRKPCILLHRGVTKVPDLEVRTEISADAALADAGCATLASPALDTDRTQVPHPTRRIRRVRRTRNLNNPHDEGRDGKHTSRIPVSFEYTSNTPLPKASAI